MEWLYRLGAHLLSRVRRVAALWVEDMRRQEVVWTLLGNGEWEGLVAPTDENLFGAVVKTEDGPTWIVTYQKDEEIARYVFEKRGKVFLFMNFAKLREEAQASYIKQK